VQEICKYIEWKEKHYSTSWQIGNCNKDNNFLYVWCFDDYIVQARNANTTKEQEEVASSCKLVCLLAFLCKRSHDKHKNHSRKHKIGQKNQSKQAI
jgi:hypothetical protein